MSIRYWHLLRWTYKYTLYASCEQVPSGNIGVVVIAIAAGGVCENVPLGWEHGRLLYFISTTRDTLHI